MKEHIFFYNFAHSEKFLGSTCGVALPNHVVVWPPAALSFGRSNSVVANVDHHNTSPTFRDWDDGPTTSDSTRNYGHLLKKEEEGWMAATALLLRPVAVAISYCILVK